MAYIMPKEMIMSIKRHRALHMNAIRRRNRIRTNARQRHFAYSTVAHAGEYVEAFYIARGGYQAVALA